MERFNDRDYYRCGCCNEEFTTGEAISEHFKTEWHKEMAALALVKGKFQNLDIWLNAKGQVK